MVSFFSGFAMGSLASVQQMGFGLTVAVTMDATTIPSVLVPASMQLLVTELYLRKFLKWPQIQWESAGKPVLAGTWPRWGCKDMRTTQRPFSSRSGCFQLTRPRYVWGTRIEMLMLNPKTTSREARACASS